MQELCPCGSTLSYDQCCEPFIRGTISPATAEQLMRSRYTAYAKNEVNYILTSTHPEKRKQCDEKAIRTWSQNSVWNGLEILGKNKGEEQDSEGTVEFIAHFIENRIKQNLHENALFKKVDNQWYYIDSEVIAQKPFVRTEIKISRNDNCPCGSGKKYKKCCGK